MGSNSAFDKSQVNFVLDSSQKSLNFNYKNQLRSLIDPISPFAQSVMTRIIARRLGQAIFVDGIGLEPISILFDWELHRSH
jgi:hypothetical protein